MNFDAQLALIGEKLDHTALFDHTDVVLLAEPMALF
jgi:hypothetical protein